MKPATSKSGPQGPGKTQHIRTDSDITITGGSLIVENEDTPADGQEHDTIQIVPITGFKVKVIKINGESYTVPDPEDWSLEIGSHDVSVFSDGSSSGVTVTARGSGRFRGKKNKKEWKHTKTGPILDLTLSGKSQTVEAYKIVIHRTNLP